MTKRIKRGEKNARTYVECQSFPQSSKNHEATEISDDDDDDDEPSVVTRSYGISDSEQPDSVVTIPGQYTIRQKIHDLCGEGDNDQILADELDPILEPIRKENEAKF